MRVNFDAVKIFAKLNILFRKLNKMFRNANILPRSNCFCIFHDPTTDMLQIQLYRHFSATFTRRKKHLLFDTFCETAASFLPLIASCLAGTAGFCTNIKILLLNNQNLKPKTWAAPRLILPLAKPKPGT
ncbi:MAG: hypothetical protein FWG06_01900 [Clostridiales bacterium]|nr:hypothetical protein [Clostridiales bacterium]